MTILLYITVFAMVIVTGLVFVRARARDLEKSGRFADAFYESAKRLVADSKTPEEIVDLILFLGREIGKPNLARSFFGQMLSFIFRQRSIKIDSGKRRSPKVNEIVIGELPTEVLQSFSEALVFAMLSSASSDALFSRLYVNVLNIYLSKTGRPGDETSQDRIAGLMDSIISMNSNNMAAA